MQRTIWAVKRAHWRSWAGSMRLLREKGPLARYMRKVTPARYDVLHLLFRCGAMAQKALREALGVVKSTLSELLATMEHLGLVERSARTRAGRIVSLTKEGDDAYAYAWTVELEVDDRVTRAFNDSDRRQLHVEKACLTVRKAFDDFGPRLLYEFLVVGD